MPATPLVHWYVRGTRLAHSYRDWHRMRWHTPCIYRGTDAPPENSNPKYSPYCVFDRKFALPCLWALVQHNRPMGINVLRNSVQQGGPGYPPQGVGSPDP